MKKWHQKGMKGGKSGGGWYFLGFIGAAVYYVHIAHGFGSDIVGILKAIVWPAFLVYHLLAR